MRKIALLKLALLLMAAGVLSAQRKPLREFELKAESPKFWELMDAGAKLEKVAGDFGFTEGPMWDERGFLYVSDEEQNKIFRVYPDGRKEAFLSVIDPDGSTFDRNHRLVTAASKSRMVIEARPDGSYKVLADKYDGKKFNSPNDVVLGPDGALYFTDPTLDLPKDQKQELSFQGVFRLAADGTLRLLIQDLMEPNGLAFSPDGKRLYVDDTKQRTIHVYDVMPDGGVKNGRLFGKQEGPPRSGSADGMRVDRKGNLWVTGPLGIWVWDPAGHHLGTIVVPESAANLAWGDKDYQTLYITASTSVYRIRTKAIGFVPR